MYLDKINGPEDVKKLKIEELQPLADVNGSLVKNATYPHNAYKLGFSN